MAHAHTNITRARVEQGVLCLAPTHHAYPYPHPHSPSHPTPVQQGVLCQEIEALSEIVRHPAAGAAESANATFLVLERNSPTHSPT